MVFPLKSTVAISVSLVALFLGWFWLLPNGGKPRTVSQSVEYLLTELSEEQLKQIAATPTEEGLADFHFSYGMSVRNEFLWGGNLRLILSIGKKEAFHPDMASHYVLVALWKALNAAKS